MCGLGFCLKTEENPYLFDQVHVPGSGQRGAAGNACCGDRIEGFRASDSIWSIGELFFVNQANKEVIHEC